VTRALISRIGRRRRARFRLVPARPQPVSVRCRAPGRPSSSRARVGRPTSDRPASTGGRTRPGSPVDELPNADGRSPPPLATGADRRQAVRSAFLSDGAPPRRRRQGLADVDGRSAHPNGPTEGRESRWRAAAHQPRWPKRESSALLPSCPLLGPPRQVSCGVSCRRARRLPRYPSLTPDAGRRMTRRAIRRNPPRLRHQRRRWRAENRRSTARSRPR
jgi:hypothetical protein